MVDKIQPHSSLFIIKKNQLYIHHHAPASFTLIPFENSATNTPYAAHEIHIFTIENSVIFFIEACIKMEPHSPLKRALKFSHLLHCLS